MSPPGYELLDEVGHGGIARRSKGDLDGAVAACKEAIRLDPKYTGAHHNLGIALQGKGNLDGRSPFD